MGIAPALAWQPRRNARFRSRMHSHQTFLYLRAISLREDVYRDLFEVERSALLRLLSALLSLLAFAPLQPLSSPRTPLPPHRRLLRALVKSAFFFTVVSPRERNSGNCQGAL